MKKIFEIEWDDSKGKDYIDADDVKSCLDLSLHAEIPCCAKVKDVSIEIQSLHIHNEFCYKLP